jgi:hypothetical protein
MNMVKIAALSALLLSTTTAANAALYNFELTGAHTASFQLDSNPTVDGYSTSPSTESFLIFNVATTLDGNPTTAAFSFGDAASLVQFWVTGPFGSPTLFQAVGDAAFTGPGSAPTFLLGDYALTDRSDSNLTYSLKITDAGAVPEPASWAMMIGGFALAGGAIRTRRKNIAFA